MDNKRRVTKRKNGGASRREKDGSTRGSPSTTNGSAGGSRPGVGLRVLEGGRRDQGDRAGRDSRPHRKGGRTSPRVRRRRRLVAVLLTMVAMGLITFLLLGPILRTIESRQALDRAEEELEEERARTRTLEDRRNRALSEDFIEEEARKMNYVKPGEIPIIILDDENSDAEGEAETEEASAPASSP